MEIFRDVLVIEKKNSVLLLSLGILLRLDIENRSAEIGANYIITGADNVIAAMRSEVQLLLGG